MPRWAIVAMSAAGMIWLPLASPYIAAWGVGPDSFADPYEAFIRAYWFFAGATTAVCCFSKLESR